MKIIANIWDKVLVVDDLIDLDIIDNYTNHLDSLGEKELAYIKSGDSKIYDAGTGVFQSQVETEDSEYVRMLFASGLVPSLPDHKTYFNTRIHQMEIGSLMAIHTDFKYSIAVTTYCTNCTGGELVVENVETGELSKIEPKRGRTVILKCDTPHSVLEVINGVRKSIQTFITYSREGEINE